MDNKLFGKTMFEKRKQLEKTIEDISFETGVDQRRLKLYENGGSLFYQQDLFKLASYYQIDLNEFIIDVYREKKISNRVFDILRVQKDEDYQIWAPDKRDIYQSFVNGFMKREKGENSKNLESLLFSPENIPNHKPYIYLRFIILIIVLVLISILNIDVVLSNLLISILIPFALLILIFELHYPRTIKGINVITYFLVGGMVSITIVHAFRLFVGYPNSFFFSDVLTGLIEESAKIFIVFLILRRIKVKYVITGVLIGFAVGAGFDIFETSAYGIGELLNENGTFYSMQAILISRSLTSLMGIGHHFWTAILGGTLVYVSQSQRVKFKDFFHLVFIQMFFIIIMIHGLWNYLYVNYHFEVWMLIVLFNLYIFLRLLYVSYTTAKIDICIRLKEEQIIEEQNKLD